MFELQWPWLLALLPLPLLMQYFSAQEKEDAALRVPFFQQVKLLQSQNIHSRLKISTHTILLWLIWICCLLAAANPQWIGEPMSMPSSGRDLLIAVDTSDSMKIPDMQYHGQAISRVDAIKKVIGNFVETRKSDRLGLIIFASQAYLQAPLTYDRNTVNTLLQETEIGFAGLSTAIGDAIGLAVKRLRTRPDTQRVLILLTDGANTAGALNPIKAAELAAEEHVKIYTIGFGADQMIWRGQVINPSSDLDEDTMKSIAEKTGGKYFRARNIEELSEIHQELNRLEPIESEKEMFRPVKDIFYWPLSIAFILSLIWTTRTLISHYKISHQKNADAGSQ